MRRCLSTYVKNRFGSRRETAPFGFTLQQFSRYGPQLFGMLAKIGEQALLFLPPAILRPFIRLRERWNEFRLKRGHAIVNHAPCLLDRKKGDAQLVAKLFVYSALERRREKSLFTPVKAELRRSVKEKRAKP